MNQFLNHIKAAQGLYPKLFAQTEQTAWGCLFLNLRNTLSVEANHGVMLSPGDYAAAFLDCEQYYTAHHLPTRLYAYVPPDEEPILLSAAEQVGATLTRSGLQLLVCRQPQKKQISTPLQFVHLSQWDPLINEHIIGENLHLEGILRGSMTHQEYTLTVGYLFGTPVTMAGIWEDSGVMRISNVMTGEAFRGCGFAGALILHQLSLAATAQKPAYLFADNPVAIRVYQRDGMTVERPDFSLFILEKT